MGMLKSLSRRRMLRGMMNGAAVTVGLPLLDCFLNTNGTAMADGAALPLCFTSWFAGLGFQPGFWEPKKAGTGYEMSEQLQLLKPWQDKINIFSGLQVMLDGKPNSAHSSGPQANLNGDVPRGSNPIAPSFDTLIADVIGTRTRFRSLEASCEGTQQSYSNRGGSVINPSEVSPVKLYGRVFGAEFVDPNAADFKPDPKLLARLSALSAVSEERATVMRALGTADRQRLDEYFSSVRNLEHQLTLSTEKPAPLEACRVPKKLVEEGPIGPEVNTALANNKLFANILANAMACGQTQVANLLFTPSTSTLRTEGSVQTFHMTTHEESIDAQLNYQKIVWWFQQEVIKGYIEMLKAMESIKEGNGTLLDRSVVMYSTDSGSARVHSTDNMPFILAGKANGRMKTGMHIRAQGDAVTRVGLTVQQIMGVPVSAWGTESNRTSKHFSEIMA